MTNSREEFFEFEVRQYVQQHVGGMQPVETLGDKIRAAFEAGWKARERADRE